MSDLHVLTSVGVALKPVTEDILTRPDREIAIEMWARWIALQAERHQIAVEMRSRWIACKAERHQVVSFSPQFAEFAEKLRIATVGIESHANELRSLPIARALSLTAQAMNNDAEACERLDQAGKIFRQLIESGAMHLAWERLAQQGIDAKRRAQANRSKGGQAPKPRFARKYLEDIGKFACSQLQKNGQPVTKRNYTAELRKALDLQQAAFDEGEVAKWPWISLGGKSCACPRQTLHDHVSRKFPARPRKHR